MRGILSGLLAGGLVSVVGLGAASVLSEQPAGLTPPDAPLVEAPQVDEAAAGADAVAQTSPRDPSTPVGSVTIQEPQAPALPEGEAMAVEPAAPVLVAPDTQAPRADTDPLDEPSVVSVEGTLAAPDVGEAANLIGQPVDPVLPNPQSLAPQTPVTEADLTVSTAPAQPVVVVDAQDDVAVVVDDTDAEGGDATAPDPQEELFVVDLGTAADPATPDSAAVGAQTDEDSPVDTTDAATPETELETETQSGADAQVAVGDAVDQTEDDILASVVPEPAAPTSAAPRLQLQGGENTLLGDRETGVTIRRPGADAAPEEETTEALVQNALVDFAADAPDAGATPLMSVVLIDDGSMSAAAAALSGLPFPVTIALDPALPTATALMTSYREAGFEIAVMAKVPEGAVPSDVEITFESVFSTLPETVAVLDIGEGGLQSDRAVTEQAMDILAAQGRGFVTLSQGLNMAGRAAEQAQVPSAVVFRDLDSEGQDARVIRRFVDQAAFRARQESGVILVGRVRPDTISALILWGTANQNDQVAIVPVSAVLLAQ